MKKAVIAAAVFAVALVLLAMALAAFRRSVDQNVRAGDKADMDKVAEGAEAAETADYQGFLYGRVSTTGGGIFEGRLRWGGGEEAFWGDYFNGAKNVNSWAALVPVGRLPKVRRPIEIFGFEVAHREREIDLARLFMARFGDIARIEVRGRLVQVTLKSGTVFDLDLFAAGDVDDGVRVWDTTRGVVDLDSGKIRTIEFLATAPLNAAPQRLHGTVRTRQGDFTGFIQWNRTECVGSDELFGRTADGPLSLRFDTVRSIERDASDGSRVTLADGRELSIRGRDIPGLAGLGIYVDDPRFGRVLISWDAFQRVDFSVQDSGPAYDDFPPGRPLTGSVTVRGGRRIAGRLVFDLDESETTETLDAPFDGVDYTLPFGRLASIVLAGSSDRSAKRAKVTLMDGGELELERSGDLGHGNAGLLVFADGREHPDYVLWTEVERLDFDRPPASDPSPLPAPPHAHPRTVGGDRTGRAER